MTAIKKTLNNSICFILFIILTLLIACDDSTTDPAPPSPDELTITTAQLSSGTVSALYSQSLSAQGGESPYTWSRTSGILPTGLTLDTTTGTITGTPTNADTVTFSVSVSDTETVTAHKDFSITVYPEIADNECDCDPLTDTVVGDVINVGTVAELEAAVNTINSSGGNRTVLIEDGEYLLNNTLYVRSGNDNVVFRSASGIRENVVIKRTGMFDHYEVVKSVFLIASSNVTIADVSLGETTHHGIQLQGERGAGNLLVHNVRFFNTGEQMLKGSGSSDDALGSENCIVECSLFEYTASSGLGPRFYIGGIDVHHGFNWIVRNNTFRNIRSPSEQVAEHAVHFWSESENPVIEQNTIINCDRGIGLGLNSSGCIGGTIKNNMIYANNQGIYNDVGIALESAVNVRILNNTVFLEDYQNAIEYRWSASTDNEIINNLTNKRIISRNDGQATVQNNVVTAQSSWFTNTASGDLHLAYEVSSVVDSGETLDDVQSDIDCELRPAGSGVDIGADEF